jgi:hypothetical protein
MRIIKEGKLPGPKPDIEHQLACTKCHTEFAFLNSEVIFTDTGNYPFIQCPLCNKIIGLPREEDYSVT